jgi:hypothetical protein
MPVYCKQRLRFGEVPGVSQRDGAERHDTLDSDARHLPKAKGGFAPAASKPLLAEVFRRMSFVLPRAL